MQGDLLDMPAMLRSKLALLEYYAEIKLTVTFEGDGQFLFLDKRLSVVYITFSKY
jgi:hypothetical protein